MRAALAAMVLSLAGPALASDFSLIFPVKCTLGETCHIQQYMDRDPGPGARDFACGPLSYDGHRGTDVALPTLKDMERGVDVIAAAPGIVLGVRDGMRDVIYTPALAEAITGRECGNGVVLEHGDGWVTQYCHLKQGSVSVTQGQRVAAGDRLGQIGLSGRTEFPHLHLSVRKEGRDIDPFGPANDKLCHAPPAGDASLWADPIPYTAGGLLDVGFSDAVPEFDQIKAGQADRDIVPTSPAFVLFAYVFGGRAGDRMILHIAGPDGEFFNHDVTLDRTQAKLFRAAGKRMRDPWPQGSYTGTVLLLRGERVIDRATASITVK